jgi:hypothetical protein
MDVATSPDQRGQTMALSPVTAAAGHVSVSASTAWPSRIDKVDTWSQALKKSLYPCPSGGCRGAKSGPSLASLVTIRHVASGPESVGSEAPRYVE